MLPKQSLPILYELSEFCIGCVKSEMLKDVIIQNESFAGNERRLGNARNFPSVGACTSSQLRRIDLFLKHLPLPVCDFRWGLEHGTAGFALNSINVPHLSHKAPGTRPRGEFFNCNSLIHIYKNKILRYKQLRSWWFWGFLLKPQEQKDKSLAETGCHNNRFERSSKISVERKKQIISNFIYTKRLSCF